MRVLVVLLLTVAGLLLAAPVASADVCVQAGAPCGTSWWHPHG